MKKTQSRGVRLLAGAWIILTASGAGAAPPNNACGSAQVVTAGTSTAGTTVGASSDVSSTSCAATPTDSIDVWYSFTPPTTGAYVIDTIGSTSLTDTTLAIYSACGGAELHCNDDGDGGSASVLLAPLSAGVSYKVRVAGWNLTTGVFKLNISSVATPGGADGCGAATAVTAGRSYLGDNSAATSDLAQSSCSEEDNLDVWFTFTPATTAYYAINTLGSTGLEDTTLSIFRGCGGPEVYCADDTPGNLLSSINAQLTAGTVYKLRVAGYAGGFGAFVLNVGPPVQASAVPSNDHCSGARVIGALPFIDNTDISGATPDTDIASCNAAGASIPNGVWFKYTPTVNRTLQVREQTLLNTFLAVFTSTGACSGPFVEVPGSCGFDQTIDVVAGRTYYILVGSAAAAPLLPPAVISLSVDSVVRPANDSCAAAAVVTSSLSINTDNSLALSENAEPAGACNAPGAPGVDHSIWYTFTPAVGGPLTGTIDSAAAQYDLVGVLYTGVCGVLTQVACFDRGGDPLNLSIPDTGSSVLNAGTRYFLAIGVWGTGSPGGDTQVSISLPTSGGGGACCAGSICVAATAGTCVGANRFFAGTATACNSFGLNNRSPCCLADFNHMGGVTVQDIFDFLGGFFAGDFVTDINGMGGVTVQDVFDFLAAYFGACL